jgi:short-subunit dehydrogenase
VSGFTCDLSQAAERAGLIAHLNEAAGQIDLLVNCAGIGSHSRLDQLTIEELQQVLQVNTLAPLELVTGLRPRFPQQEAGCIVNIGSVAGELCPPGMSAYAASKAALHAFSRSMAIELAGTGMCCLLVILAALRGAHFTQSIRHPAGGQPGWYRRLDATPQAAARAIISAVQSGRTRLVYPAWYAWVLALARLGGPLSEMASRQAYQKMRSVASQPAHRKPDNCV